MGRRGTAGVWQRPLARPPKTEIGVKMKRDLDVIREILLEVEALKPRQMMVYELSEEPDKYYNALLLFDAGYVRTLEERVVESKNSDPGDIGKVSIGDMNEGIVTLSISKWSIEDMGTLSIRRLTNDGHDLLDAVRSESVLNQVKEIVQSTGGIVALEFIKVAAQSLVKAGLGS